jgi:hypothetical protein
LKKMVIIKVMFRLKMKFCKSVLPPMFNTTQRPFLVSKIHAIVYIVLVVWSRTESVQSQDAAGREMTFTA